MAGMGSYGGAQLVAASKACGAADFSAVLVKSEQQSSLSREVQSDTAPTVFGGSFEHGLASLDESPGRWDVHRVPLESGDLLLPTTILRI
jgi:hypothetical protein